MDETTVLSSTMSRACSTRSRPSSPRSFGFCGPRAEPPRSPPRHRGRGGHDHRLPDARHDRRRAAAAAGQEVAPEALRIILTAYTDVDNLMEAINTGQSGTSCPSRGIPPICWWSCGGPPSAGGSSGRTPGCATSWSWPTTPFVARRPRRVSDPISFDGLVGQHTGLRRAVELARKVLDGDTTVLLLGETGTGKELFARLLHDNWPAPRRPLRGAELRGAPRDPAGIRALRPRPRGLHRGHRRAARPLRRGRRRHHLPRRGRRDVPRDAAPPAARPAGGGGAPGRRRGVAQGGRARRRRHQRRPRGRRRRRSLPRATSTTASTCSRSPLPPLRERTEDIPALAETSCARPVAGRGGRSRRSRRRRMALLQAYPLPGNVRELENEIERAVALAEDGRPHRARASLRSHAGRRRRPAAARATLAEAIEQLKRRMIEDALRDCGSKTRAAERLGLSRQSFQQMLRRRQP